MECDRCAGGIEKDEERQLHGQTLCEDCYMDSLSPSRTCDPWGVHRAKSFKGGESQEPQLNDLQQAIVAILKETGGVEPAAIMKELEIKPADFQREIAPLRHLEIIRGEIRGDRRVLRLW